MKKIYSLILASAIFSFNLTAQSPTYQWAKSFNTTGGGAETKEIVTDNNGFVYVTGILAGPMDFDPGPGTLNLSASGLSGAYIGKYDPSGNLVWAFKLDGSGTVEGRGIAVDNIGNVFVTGKFQNIVDFDPSAGTANLTSSTAQDFYLAKYSPSGIYINAIKVSSSISCIGYDVAINSINEVLVSGKFSGTADFDPGPGTLNLTASPSAGGFLAKYTNTLSVVWANMLGGTGGIVDPKRIEFDGLDKIYLCGDFTNTCDMDGGPGVSNIVTNNVVSNFFAKYNTNGTLRWAKAISSSNGSAVQTSYDLALDANANIYLAGSINTYSVDFDPSIVIYNLIASGTNGFDGYLAKYDSTGNFIRSFLIGVGNQNEEITGVDCDVNSNPVVVGYYHTGTDFDPGAGNYTLTPNGTFDSPFTAKYNSSGNFLWAFDLVPSPSTGPWPFMQCDVSNSNYLHINGNFNQTVDFDPSASTASLFSSGSSIYIAKYDAGCTSAPSQPGTINGNNTICNGSINTYSVAIVVGATSYTWSLPGGWTGTSSTNTIGTTASSTSGNLTVTATNACGTSAAQTLSVTVNTIPATPGVISGSVSLCTGASAINYSIASVAGATSYSWTIPGSWTGSSTTNIISATPGSSGTFTVKAINSCGASAAQTLSVTVNSLPIISVNSGSICSGSSFTITPSGASTYTFSSGSAIVSPTANASYSVSGTSSAGCVSSSSAVSNVTVFTNPTANAGSSQTITCSFPSVPLNGSGVSTYTWSGPGIVSGGNTASPIVNMAGTYSLVGSTSGCNSNTATVNVLTNTIAPTVTAASNSSLICGPPFQGTATLTATGSAATYSWIPSGSGASISVSPSVTATYTVIATGSNGCTNMSTVTQMVSTCTGIKTFEEALGLAVYPNPTTGKITITYKMNWLGFEIYNSIGEKLQLNKVVGKENVEVDLSSLPDGIYFVKVGSVTRKIIKQ